MEKFEGNFPKEYEESEEQKLLDQINNSYKEAIINQPEEVSDEFADENLETPKINEELPSKTQTSSIVVEKITPFDSSRPRSLSEEIQEQFERELSEAKRAKAESSSEDESENETPDWIQMPDNQLTWEQQQQANASSSSYSSSTNTQTKYFTSNQAESYYLETETVSLSTRKISQISVHSLSSILEEEEDGESKEVSEKKAIEKGKNKEKKVTFEELIGERDQREEAIIPKEKDEKRVSFKDVTILHWLDSEPEMRYMELDVSGYPDLVRRLIQFDFSATEELAETRKRLKKKEEEMMEEDEEYWSETLKKRTSRRGTASSIQETDTQHPKELINKEKLEEISKFLEENSAPKESSSNPKTSTITPSKMYIELPQITKFPSLSSFSSVSSGSASEDTFVDFEDDQKDEKLEDENENENELKESEERKEGIRIESGGRIEEVFEESKINEEMEEVKAIEAEIKQLEKEGDETIEEREPIDNLLDRTEKNESEAHNSSLSYTYFEEITVRDVGLQVNFTWPKSTKYTQTNESISKESMDFSTFYSSTKTKTHTQQHQLYQHEERETEEMKPIFLQPEKRSIGVNATVMRAESGTQTVIETIREMSNFQENFGKENVTKIRRNFEFLGESENENGKSVMESFSQTIDFYNQKNKAMETVLSQSNRYNKTFVSDSTVFEREVELGKKEKQKRNEEDLIWGEKSVEETHQAIREKQEILTREEFRRIYDEILAIRRIIDAPLDFHHPSDGTLIKELDSGLRLKGTPELESPTKFARILRRESIKFLRDLATQTEANKNFGGLSGSLRKSLRKRLSLVKIELERLPSASEMFFNANLERKENLEREPLNGVELTQTKAIETFVQDKLTEKFAFEVNEKNSSDNHRFFNDVHSACKALEKKGLSDSSKFEHDTEKCKLCTRVDESQMIITEVPENMETDPEEFVRKWKESLPANAITIDLRFKRVVEPLEQPLTQSKSINPNSNHFKKRNPKNFPKIIPKSLRKMKKVKKKEMSLGSWKAFQTPI